MRTSVGVAAVSFALLLSGCAVVPTSNTIQSNSVQGVTFQGRVHGGQSPISGAKVYLYAVGSAFYAGPGISPSSGNASASLLSPYGYVTTDSNGNFTITGDYSCSGNQQLYLYAIGGNPGLASGTNNTAAGLMAPLGPCSSLSSSIFVLMDEVSTVATAYALAGYASDATHISSSGSPLAQTGVANAFSSIANLEKQSTGMALATTPNNNGTVPQAEINTLANILAACINTDGAITGPTNPTPCYTLLNSAPAAGTSGTAPTDTATAAINIAHNPWANITSLFGLQTASAPFQPSLSTAPNDFTIAVSYTGGGLAMPIPIAIDKSGNVWAANDYDSVSEFSPIGAALSGSSGFTGAGLYYPGGIAIDAAGDVWVTDNKDSAVSELSSSGVGISSYTGGGLSQPVGVAIDTSGDVWVTNAYGGSVSEFSSSGAAISPTNGFDYPNLPEAGGVAVDTSGNIWIALNTNPGYFVELNSSGTGTAQYSGGGMLYPGPVTIDASGNMWTSNYATNALSEFSSGGTAMSGSGYTGGGLNYPTSVAIDGSGNVWVGNNTGKSISVFNSSGTAISGSGGYTGGLATNYLGIAIDGAGNVWATSPLTTSLTEFVGAASPVVTPIVANLKSPYGSHAVNKP